MRLDRGWKRLLLEGLVLVVVIGAAELTVPEKVVAQPDCSSNSWDGQWFQALEYCHDNSQSNCGGVIIRCPLRP